MQSPTRGVDDGPLGSQSAAAIRQRWSLQVWLMVTVTGVVALILIGSAIGTSAIFSGILQTNLESKLRLEADRLRLSDVAQASAPRGSADVLEESHQKSGFLLVLALPNDRATGAYVDGNDTVQSLNATQLQQFSRTVDLAGFTTVEVPKLGAYRVAPITLNGNTVGFAGVSLDELTSTISDIFGTVATVTLAGLVLLAAAVAVVVRIGLRPLRVVADTATRVASLPMSGGSVQISDRVPAELAGQRTEMGQVASALNTLLDHVDLSLDERQRNEQRTRRFVADASHELRTPLASIRGYSELTLRDRSLTEMSQRAIERVHSQSLRMTRLVEDLLLLARLDEGQELHYGPVDLSQLVIETVETVRDTNHDHVWQLELSDEPITVAGDADKLHQVILNLLANAQMHTPAGTAVTVTILRDQDYADIRVHDDGPGIDPAIHAELFERFTRGDASRTRATGGTGLGLSISRAIVNAHEGTLSAESVPGDTTFTVRLPCARTAEYA